MVFVPPPQPPNNVVVTAATVTTLSVAWDEVTASGVDQRFVWYETRVEEAGTGNAVAGATTKTPKTSWTTPASLAEATSYTVFVATLYKGTNVEKRSTTWSIVTGSTASDSCATGPPSPGATPQACSGHGVCTRGGSGSIYCECDPGYVGPACQLSCPVHATSGQPCNGHGQCIEYGAGGSRPAVIEFQSNGEAASATPADGEAVCQCADGFVGRICEAQCASTTVTAFGDLCSGAGTCHSDGNCTCTASRVGRFCESQCTGCGAGTTCVQDPGTGNAKCACLDEHVAVQEASSSGSLRCVATLACQGASGECNGVGECKGSVNEAGNDVAQCTCPENYIGAACYPQCESQFGQLCSGHGQCNAPEGGEAEQGQCVCDAGFGGSVSCVQALI